MSPRIAHRILLVAMLAATGTALAVDRNMKDDFQDGTTQGWREGPPSPNDPVNVASGGPSGPIDSYVENVSSGTFGAGGRMVMFNITSWTGDWIAAEVGSISAQVANFGTTDLHIRIAVEGAGNTRWGSTNAIVIPPDGQWYGVSFRMSTDLSPISGTATLGQVLSSVSEFRIMSAQVLDWRGDVLDGVMGVDNIRANPQVQTDLTLNDLDGPLAVAGGDSVRIGVNLDAGGVTVPADWFLIAQTAAGLFHYDIGTGSFAPGIAPTFQGALFDVAQEFGPFVPPPGTYTVYFGVDTLMNGALDLDLSSFDSAGLAVVP